MKVSINTVKQYTEVDLSVDELVQKINRQLGGVESVVNLGAKYKDAVIVKVIEAIQHPNADRLRICTVDDGGVVRDVPRDENGYVQVVCGAPNARTGIFAVWLPPKSTVPASFDDETPFVLDARPLRGILSQGMLAAGDELAINSDHEGIIEIDPAEWKPNDTEITPGASFAKVFGLDDTIIDIENKMFTHRPDLFGQLGVAREIAGIQHKQFTSPEWYANVPQFGNGQGLELSAFNDADEKAPRFMAVAMKDVAVKPSPLWLQCELVRLGGKTINNIVDVTNYIMLLTAQPTHAYDYDKLRGHTVGVRMARAGEKLTLLNHKEYQLTDDDIVIADAEGPVGLAGIMGGGDSEVDDTTKNIVLEVATFDMYAVRKTAMRHGVFTDALTRFNKGQSPRQNPYVLDLLMKSLHDTADGEQASAVIDVHNSTDERDPVMVTPSFVMDRIGVRMSNDDIKRLLGSVEFLVKESTAPEAGLLITAPFWRTDIELPEDIVEEIGRLYGFDKLPRELPKRSAAPTPINERRALVSAVRHVLARAGANEVLTYSFVHKNTIVKAGQDTTDAYRLSNALSPDLQYYRLSLTPSLLDKVHGNIRAGHDEFSLFEIGKSHSKKAGLDAEGLPVEPGRIALTYAAKTAKSGAAYYRVRRQLDYLANALGLELEYRPLPAGTALTAAVPFADGRTARVIDRTSEQVIGIIGEYAPLVKGAFKLPEYSAGFELFTEGLLLAYAAKQPHYRPLSRYPSIERDVCFEVSASVRYGDVYNVVKEEMNTIEMEATVAPIDIYQAEDNKRMTLRITLTPHVATMTREEAQAIIDTLAGAVAARVGATII